MRKFNESEFCEHCGKQLKKGREYWLELSNTDGKYYSNGIPEGHESQGCFAFGPSCYKKVKED